MAQGKTYPKQNFIFTTPARIIGGRWLDAWKDGSHNVKLLLPNNHPDLAAMKAAAQSAASQSGKWDGSSQLYLPWKTTQAAAAEAIASNKNPKKYQEVEGIVLNASTGFAPRVSIMVGDNVELLQGPARMNLGKTKHYVGAYFFLDVSFAYYDANPMTKIPGVTAYLQEVCFAKDGDKIEEFVQSSSFKGRASTQTTEGNPFS